MVNLSSKQLSQAHISLLNKGLSFVPTTQSNDFDVKVDIFKFFRQIRLREFFASPVTSNPDSVSSDVTDNELTPFRSKSKFIPPTNRNPSIETYCRLVEDDIMSLLQEKSKHRSHGNLDKTEKQSLLDLKADTSIIIREADKGGAVVVLNKSDYVNECYRQLLDEKTYTKLASNPSGQFKTTVNASLQDFFHAGDLTKKEFDFLNNQHPITPVFYTLPKIHKNLEKPPGRPIVSGIDSLTAPLSSFVDFFIRPINEQLPSFVKDTGHMISIVESLEPVTGDTILVTLDVEALYTNVPHEGGIQALEHFLAQRSPESRPSNTCIVTLAEIVLTHNYFLFQDDFFLQKSGVAMGSPMAPNYAGLYVGYLEKTKIFNPTCNPFLSKILLWKRFIDDVFLLFKGTREELHNFFLFVNACSDHLKFTMSFDFHSLNFLDLLITRGDDNRLYTDLYKKPTDRNSLLRAESCHPLPLKNSLPYSQFCRVKRICQKPTDFNRHLLDMQKKFKDRGYSATQINNAAQKINSKPRSELFHRRSDAKSRAPVVFSTRYSRAAENCKTVINKHWHILRSDKSLYEAFSQPPLTVFSRGQNLRHHLVKSDLPPTPSMPAQRQLTPIPDGNYRCGACTQCNFTHRCQSFKHPHSGKTIPIKGMITCSTTGVIYLLTCPCGKAYVGMTKRELKVRIAEHRSTIRCKNMNYPVAAHFAEANHPVSSLRYIGIEKVNVPRRGGDIEQLLLKREASWIYQLKTLSPMGLNIDFDLRPFL